MLGAANDKIHHMMGVEVPSCRLVGQMQIDELGR